MILSGDYLVSNATGKPRASGDDPSSSTVKNLKVE